MTYEDYSIHIDCEFLIFYSRTDRCSIKNRHTLSVRWQRIDGGWGRTMQWTCSLAAVISHNVSQRNWRWTALTAGLWLQLQTITTISVGNISSQHEWTFHWEITSKTHGNVTQHVPCKVFLCGSLLL